MYIGLVFFTLVGLLGGWVLIRWVMMLWLDEPSYLHAFAMYYPAYFLTWLLDWPIPYLDPFEAMQFFPLLALIYLIYSVGITLPEEKYSLLDKRRWLRGAVLTVVHLLIFLPSLLLAVLA